MLPLWVGLELQTIPVIPVSHSVHRGVARGSSWQRGGDSPAGCWEPERAGTQALGLDMRIRVCFLAQGQTLRVWE